MDRFNNLRLLAEALKHMSYLDDTVSGSYQVTEFLGDAVLDELHLRYMHFAYPVSCPRVHWPWQAVFILGAISRVYEK